MAIRFRVNYFECRWAIGTSGQDPGTAERCRMSLFVLWPSIFELTSPDPTRSHARLTPHLSGAKYFDIKIFT